MWDTLLVLSAVCRPWSQQLGGDSSGRFDSWRHVPKVFLHPVVDRVEVNPGEREMKPAHYESALRTLRRVRSMSVHVSGADNFDSCIHFLPRFPHKAQASSSQASRVSHRVWLDHLTLFCTLWPQSERESDRISTALSASLLRCPPLRSIYIHANANVVCTPAALCHEGRSTRLVHVEMAASMLSTMVWSDRLEAIRPWRGASTLQSLALNSSVIHEPDLTIMAMCRALPALSHLHLPNSHNYDVVQRLTQHLGDQLTFLRLHVDGPLARSPALPHSVSVQLTALRSLCLMLRSGEPHSFQLSEHLHLLPRLSELTILDHRALEDGGAAQPLILSSTLPAGLVYLQLQCNTRLIVPPSGSARGEPVELILPLLPSLLCLSLALPVAQITDRLLSSLPALFPHLTHFFIGNTDWDDSAEWMQKLAGLRSQLGEEVWCETAAAVEEQRLDRRWQREVGVEVSGYGQRVYS